MSRLATFAFFLGPPALVAAAIALRTSRAVESYETVMARVRAFAPQTHAASESEGVDEDLLRAVAAAESAGDPEARSRAGAVGLMQLESRTASEMASRLGERRPDLLEPATSLRLGARYLRSLLDRFEGLPCSEEIALAAYNAGPEKVQEWLAAGPAPTADGVLEWPRFAETRAFLRRVLDYEVRFRAESAAGPSR